ncbi:MAG: hypothetical protein PUK59_02380 [Actinomycetaceae bacterium]|nr:hypothetical protein [Actinomycetaceae bacterium]
MTDALTLKMIFEGPMRVGTGYAGKGLDEVIDTQYPLHETAIKGVIRDSARILVAQLAKWDRGDDHPFITAVFGGGHGQISPWNFSVEIPQPPRLAARAGIKLNEDGIVEPGYLLMKEELWWSAEKPPKLTVIRRGTIEPPEGVNLNSESVINAHLALIHLAARLTQKIGQRKARGMGWVSFSAESSGRPERSVKEDLDAVTEAVVAYSQLVGEVGHVSVA